jgi:ligand-binding sensor domain-containing protein
MLDFVSLAADPSAGVVFAGSYGGGLLEIGKDNSLRIYKQQTGLQEAIGDKGSYRVAGLVMDQKGTLWIANYGAPQDLVARKKDGSWKRFTIPFLHTENAISQILLDEYDRKWIVSPKGNGVFCLDDGGTIDNITDDRWRYFRQGRGNGNLPTSEVQCLARDRDGFIWVGTAKGIAVIECMDDVFSGKCEAVLPVVQQDNFAGLLFSDEEVRTIAVDGANRKWVGTRNGVWLLSSDGTKVIHRFTEANSPLLSNIIHRIAIDPATGEVFISTFNGICSFRGTATESEENEGKVLVFPNPVPPGYTGTIAIRGLVRDAFVKITEPDGRLVHQTRALGGQAIWDGRNYKGEKVSSGVYLVFIMDENGLNSQAAKIFFVR